MVARQSPAPRPDVCGSKKGAWLDLESVTGLHKLFAGEIEVFENEHTSMSFVLGPLSFVPCLRSRSIDRWFSASVT